jgi:hypothetical protein
MRFEGAFFSEMSEELSSGNVFHEEIEKLGVLSDTIQVDLS